MTVHYHTLSARHFLRLAEDIGKPHYDRELNARIAQVHADLAAMGQLVAGFLELTEEPATGDQRPWVKANPSITGRGGKHVDDLRLGWFPVEPGAIGPDMLVLERPIGTSEVTLIVYGSVGLVCERPLTDEMILELHEWIGRRVESIVRTREGWGLRQAGDNLGGDQPHGHASPTPRDPARVNRQGGEDQQHQRDHIEQQLQRQHDQLVPEERPVGNPNDTITANIDTIVQSYANAQRQADDRSVFYLFDADHLDRPAAGTYRAFAAATRASLAARLADLDDDRRPEGRQLPRFLVRPAIAKQLPDMFGAFNQVTADVLLDLPHDRNGLTLALGKMNTILSWPAEG